MKKDLREAFILAIKTEKTFDFPGIAKRLELSFTKDIVPLLTGTNAVSVEFQGAIDEALHEIKYGLADSLLSSALYGEKGGNKISAANIKQAIALIDSGILTMRDRATPENKDAHSDRVSEVLKELGAGND